MKQRDRYDISGLEEAQFEPRSHGRVLKNLLGIKSKREMDRVEAREQLRVLEKLVAQYNQRHRFTAADICKIHRIWLGAIYAWAGKYRQVQLTKDNFAFASAAQIPRLMREFERGPLRIYTPCNFKSLDEVAKAMAVVHVELVLIHPFREGNGRVVRLLSVLIGLQAGLPPLDFGGIAGKKREQYSAAVRAGLGENYGPMEEVFRSVIGRTLKRSGPQRALSS